MKKILLSGMILLSANCLAKDEYKYAGVIWDDQKNNPIIFRVLFSTKAECETEMQNMVNLTMRTSKIKQFFSCSSVFLGTR